MLFTGFHLPDHNNLAPEELLDATNIASGFAATVVRVSSSISIPCAEQKMNNKPANVKPAPAH
jgi:hypothetical protein